MSLAAAAAASASSLGCTSPAPSALASNNNKNNEVPPSADVTFLVGQLVSVQSRTWPGINKPGGIGRITEVSFDSSNDTVVSVKYVVERGQEEKGIAVKYVQHHSLPTNTLRDRSMLLGRCTRCGSLRTDCGSCDVNYSWMSGPHPRHQQPSRGKTITTRITQKSTNYIPQQYSDQEDSSDSSDFLDLATMLEKYRLDYQKYKRLRKFSAEANSCMASSESSDVTKRLNHRRESNLRTKPVKSILVTAAQKSSSNDGSSDDCSGDEANKQSSKEAVASPSSFVSNPGSADFDTEETLVESSAGERSSLRGQAPFYMHRSAAASYTFDNDYQMNDIGAETAIDDDFIQPEGNADELPSDVYDATAHLEYSELLPFFDSTIQRVETVDFPACKSRVLQLEREWKEYPKAQRSILKRKR